MRRSRIEDYWRGWFIGNFDPAVLKTDQFEVGVLTHTKGEYWAPHYHKVALEYNVLLDGKMHIKFSDGSVEHIKPGDVFVFEREEISIPFFDEDCRVLVIKVPSVKGDKYVVE